jgi:hypothetical protein
MVYIVDAYPNLSRIGCGKGCGVVVQKCTYPRPQSVLTLDLCSTEPTFAILIVAY